jgi:hypothetical protein
MSTQHHPGEWVEEWGRQGDFRAEFLGSDATQAFTFTLGLVDVRVTLIRSSELRVAATLQETP